MPSAWRQVTEQEIRDALATRPASRIRQALLDLVARYLAGGDRADVHLGAGGRLTFLVERPDAPPSTDQWWDPPGPEAA